MSRKSPELRRLLAYETRVFNPARAWLREVDLGEFAEMGAELDMMLVALHCVLRLEATQTQKTGPDGGPVPGAA